MTETQINDYLSYSEAVREALKPGYTPDVKQEVVTEDPIEEPQEPVVEEPQEPNNTTDNSTEPEDSNNSPETEVPNSDTSSDTTEPTEP